MIKKSPFILYIHRMRKRKLCFKFDDTIFEPHLSSCVPPNPNTAICAFVIKYTSCDENSAQDRNNCNIAGIDVRSTWNTNVLY